MTQPIKHSLALASTLAVLVSGCLLKIDGLDAGLDDSTSGDDELSDTLECLTGTEIDAVGVTQSSWSPGCEVTCDDGWGHDGDPLPIAWTTTVPVFPEGSPSAPRAIGLLGNGRVVVAIISTAHTVALQHFEPDGLNFGGYDIEGLGATIHGVEIDSNVVYIAHGDNDGTIKLRAVAIDQQQQLWEQSFAGAWASKPARTGGKLAFIVMTDPELSSRELVVLDLDGETLWTEPAVEAALGVAFSPSGGRIAVVGETTRVYAAADGELLEEFVHNPGFPIYPQSAAFADEDRVVTIGSGLEYERFDAWLSGDSLAGGGSWEHSYNRARSWCPDPEVDDDWSASTAELLGGISTLADGSLVVAGTENFEAGDVFGSHPWVARISADGELLGRDRGLWNGYAIDTVAGPDGSVFVLIGEGNLYFCESPCPVSDGFAVRKYVP